MRELPARLLCMNILRHSEYKDLILIDGYNLLFADKELFELSKDNLEEARTKLENLLAGYALYVKKQIVVVYDGHFVKNNRGEEMMKDNLGIIFTRENETADTRIESLSYTLTERFNLTVVTSDFSEQTLMLMNEVERVGSREFMAKLKDSYALEKKMHKRDKKANDTITSDWKETLKKIRKELDQD